MKWTRRHLLAAGLAIIGLANGVALLNVAYNRSGEPESVLRLTERELRPTTAGTRRENSGLALQIRYRTLPAEADALAYLYGSSSAPAWLDAKKMAELGFDTTMPETEVETERSFHRQLDRDVFLVLELDGPAYQAALEGAAKAAEELARSKNGETAKSAERILPSERNLRSRLFVVDAGLDAAALRAKYADRSRYAIVRGEVGPMWTGAGSRKHTGMVKSLRVSAINVPLGHRRAFEGAVPDDEWIPNSAGRGARYGATIAFGKRLEPWMVEAAKK